MKLLLWLFVLALTCNSCVKERNCPEISSDLVSDKVIYKQFERIHLKMLYSDRATTYEWKINDKKYKTTSSEFTINSASELQSGYVGCTASIGECKSSTHIYIYTTVVNIPACIITPNTLSIDTMKFNVINTSLNKKTSTVSGKLYGIGASVNDSIIIKLPTDFIYTDSINLYDITTGTDAAAEVKIRYGNYRFDSETNSTYTLLYTRTPTGANVKCCYCSFVNYALSMTIKEVKFSFDIIF